MASSPSNLHIFKMSAKLKKKIKIFENYIPWDLISPTLHPRTIFHRCQIVSWDHLNAKNIFLKINLFGLCENAWLRPSRKGVYLQNQSYCSCYLTWTTKIGTKLGLDMCLIPMAGGATYRICIFMNINKNLKFIGKIIKNTINN